jgi:hypothetical protein
MIATKVVAVVKIECNTNQELVSRLLSLADRIKRGEFKGNVELENKQITTEWEVTTEPFSC